MDLRIQIDLTNLELWMEKNVTAELSRDVKWRAVRGEKDVWKNWNLEERVEEGRGNAFRIKFDLTFLDLCLVKKYFYWLQ